MTKTYHVADKLYPVNTPIDNVYYFSKIGSSTNDGRTIETPLLSPNECLTKIAALTGGDVPSATNLYAVVCLDGGNYIIDDVVNYTNPVTGAATTDTAKILTIPSYVEIYAPNASFTGLIVQERFSRVVLGTSFCEADGLSDLGTEWFIKGSNFMIPNISYTGDSPACCECRNVQTRGAAFANFDGSARYQVKFNKVYCNAPYGVDATHFSCVIGNCGQGTTFASINSDGLEVTLNSNYSCYMYINKSTIIRSRVNSIYELSGTNTYGFNIPGLATVHAYVGNIIADTAILVDNSGGGATLNLFTTKVNGSIAANGSGANGILNLFDVSGDTITHGTLQVDNIKIATNSITSEDTNGDISLTPNGTGEVNITKVDIDAGTIDGTTLGGASAVTITNATIATVDNITINGDSITDATNDLTIEASGATKDLVLKAATDVVLDPATNSAYIDKGGVEYEILTEQAISKQSNYYVKEPTTNTSFSSDANNNPYGFYFDDGKPRYGCEKIHIMGLVEIKDGDNMPMYDSAGKKGYHPINALTGKIDKRAAFFGAWTFENNSNGARCQSSGSGDYVIVTEIMNKLNLMTLFDATADVLSVYVDGVDTTNNITLSGSNVLAGRYYNAYQTINVPLTSGGVSAVAQGIHTVKLVKDDTNATYFYGIEIVNEAHSSGHEICIPACTYIIKGKEVAFSAYTGANALPLKGTTANGGQAISTGTKGGFVGYYPDETGVYISKVTEPTGTSQSGSIAYNAASSDSITGLSDSSIFYANSQGNIIRVKDAGSTDRMLLVPTAAPSGTEITCANDYDGAADTTLFAGNKQFQNDGSTGSTFADLEAVTVELYAKIGANADHTNEELYSVKAWDKVKNKIVDRSRTVHFGDFGNQRSDDFTSLAAANADMAFTMDDGSTTLVGEDVLVDTGALFQTGAADFNILTFYGSGLDLEVVGYGVVKICSDLPLGFHTVKFLISAGGYTDWYIDGILVKVGTQAYKIYNYLIYRPKKPVLTDNYEYSAINYVLADYVKTNLPTLNLSPYNGAIDQGVIRKANVREFVYTGTGTWTYEAVSSSKASGRWINLPASNDGNVKITVFGSGQFRWWLRHQNNSDTITISKDGAALETAQALGNINLNGRAVSALTIGTECLCTLDVERVTNTNGEFDHDCLDYHAPVFNQFYNLANPFPDYLMGQTGVLDNRKLVDYDKMPSKRVKKCYTTVTGTVTTSGVQECSLCNDLEADISFTTSNFTATVASTSMECTVEKDGTVLVREDIYFTGVNTTWGASGKETDLPSKRVRYIKKVVPVSNNVTYRGSGASIQNKMIIEEK